MNGARPGQRIDQQDRYQNKQDMTYQTLMENGEQPSRNGLIRVEDSLEAALINVDESIEM